MEFVKPFDELSLHDIALVGGKNASLGHMVTLLKNNDINVPTGFAVTVHAYTVFLQENNLIAPIHELLNNFSIDDAPAVGSAIRKLIEQGDIPPVVQQAITKAYHDLSSHYRQQDVDVAVRSSATAEDLPNASFAGQQETFLNIQGETQLLKAYKSCIASLFTDRALVYRALNNIDHAAVKISVGVQKMIRSDLACSGVAFSLDPDTGHSDITLIEAVYGLGELLVQGHVIPDEYRVYTPLANKHTPIISKTLGQRDKKLVYGQRHNTTVTKPIPAQQKNFFCLTDDEIIKISTIVDTVQKSYSQYYQHPTPMDIEWAKDGNDNKLYLIQARPETVHAAKQSTTTLNYYSLQQPTPPPLLIGHSIGQQITTGRVVILSHPDQATKLSKTDILVSPMTDPDWLPLMRNAAGIITDFGGRTCHAAIVSRELGIPAVIGTHNATKMLTNGQLVTLDCSQGAQGYVYDGKIEYEKKAVEIGALQMPFTEIMVNIADPNNAFVAAQLPGIAGVGLARIEFIIAHRIQVHPQACARPDLIHDKNIQKKVFDRSAAYNTPSEFFIQTLAEGIATLAAAFYPRPVIIRFSDFKTNEYANLLAGTIFEPHESNPMLGLRGASRYYDASYQDAFILECQALCRVRYQMGFNNIVPMIPFVRSPQEAQKVLDLMARNGIKRGTEWRIFMMVEIPSNIICFEEYAYLFDGFSIGSNDLTQFTLAVDRDSAHLGSLFDERDPAVQKLIKLAIDKARAAETYIGICGQAPSDYPEIAQSLIAAGISSISLNPDSVLPFLLRYQERTQ